MSNEFGDLLKELRLRAGFGLRSFAKLVGELPSNYCGVEQGDRPPWRTLEKLRKVANALTLEEGSKEWDQFFIAARRKESFPDDVNEMLERELNLVLLRTVHEMRLSDDDLRALVNHVRRDWKKKTARRTGRGRQNSR